MHAPANALCAPTALSLYSPFYLPMLFSGPNGVKMSKEDGDGPPRRAVDLMGLPVELLQTLWPRTKVQLGVQACKFVLQPSPHVCPQTLYREFCLCAVSWVCLLGARCEGGTVRFSGCALVGAGRFVCSCSAKCHL